MPTIQNSYRGPMLIVVAALLWAIDGVMRRNLYTLPPLTIIFFEHLIGLIILLPFVWKAVLRPKLKIREWILIVSIAFLSGLLGTLWFTTALLKVHFISFSVVFLLQKLQPLFAISTASLFLKEKIYKVYIPWMILALVSAYFVTFKNGVIDLKTGEGTIIAALYAFGAAFAWGSSTTLSKMLLRKVSSSVSTFYRFLITIMLSFGALYAFGTMPAISFPNVSQFGFLLAITLSSGMVGMLIYYKGLSKTPVHISTILELTFPFVAIFLDMILYDTVLSLSQFLAALVLVGSMYQIIVLRKKYELASAGSIGVQ